MKAKTIKIEREGQLFCLWGTVSQNSKKGVGSVHSAPVYKPHFYEGEVVGASKLGRSHHGQIVYIGVPDEYGNWNVKLICVAESRLVGHTIIGEHPEEEL